MRQLVELQLAHSAGIKGLIDHAWGVGHVKNKKRMTTDVTPTPDPSDPFSRENLSYSPLGQDCSRKRYWVVDGVYIPLFPPLAVFACICADPGHPVLSFISNVRRSPSGILSQPMVSRCPWSRSAQTHLGSTCPPIPGRLRRPFRLYPLLERNTLP